MKKPLSPSGSQCLFKRQRKSFLAYSNGEETYTNVNCRVQTTEREKNLFKKIHRKPSCDKPASHFFGAQLSCRKIPVSAKERAGGTSAQLSRHPQALHQGVGKGDLLFEIHLSDVWIWGRNRKRRGPEDSPLLSTRVFHNTPRATAKCISLQHSQILLKSLHNSSSQAKKNRAGRKQITVGKQEYLSLTTMALSNQRGRADEPLITCAIMTSVSSIPWQGRKWLEQSGTCYVLLSTGLKLI